MNTILKFLSAILILVGGFNAYNFDTHQGKSGSSGKFFQPFCDNDPIVMHSHVHTSGGLAIPGATVSLILFGTTTPQYSGTTDSNGDFTFDSVAQGSYHYKMSASNYNTKVVDLSLHVNTTRTDTLIAK